MMVEKHFFQTCIISKLSSSSLFSGNGLVEGLHQNKEVNQERKKRNLCGVGRRFNAKGGERNLEDERERCSKWDNFESQASRAVSPDWRLLASLRFLYEIKSVNCLMCWKVLRRG